MTEASIKDILEWLFSTYDLQVDSLPNTWKRYRVEKKQEKK